MNSRRIESYSWVRNDLSFFKKAGLLFSLLLSPASPANVLLETQYVGAYNSENSYTTSIGSSYSNSGSIDLRFIGVGGRYVFESAGFDILNFEINADYFFSAQNHAKNNLSILEAGAGASLNLGPHRPFLGLLYSRFYEPDTPLSIKPGLGYQIGYRFEFEPHAIFVNFSWRKMGSENPPSVNEQKTTVAMWAIGYAYRLF